jgi:hypothetical protein
MHLACPRRLVQWQGIAGRRISADSGDWRGAMAKPVRACASQLRRLVWGYALCGTAYKPLDRLVQPDLDQATSRVVAGSKHAKIGTSRFSWLSMPPRRP